MISTSLGLPAPDAAGLLIPAVKERFHAKVAPGVLLAGMYENDVPLQIAGGVRELLSVGIGFTETTTLWVIGLVHPNPVNVYTYVTFTGVAVALINVSFGFPVPEAVALLIPTTTDLLHAKFVPATPLAGIYENRVLLQIAGGANELVSAGTGLTLTETL